MTGQAIKDTFKSWGVRIADSLYSASVYSVIGYSALLLLMAAVGLAVALGVITVPEFHPK